jgi:predicted DNA-binding protein
VSSIAGDDDPLHQDKQLKVKIPLRQHLRLHSLKVLTGQTISDTVAEAVTQHLQGFDDLPEPGTDVD